MWSPSAQGGPGWKDTHPVAWNVAFGDEGLPEARAPGGEVVPKAHGLHPWGQYSQPQVRPGRGAGSVVRAQGVTGRRQDASGPDPRGRSLE